MNRKIKMQQIQSVLKSDISKINIRLKDADTAKSREYENSGTIARITPIFGLQFDLPPQPNQKDLLSICHFQMQGSFALYEVEKNGKKTPLFMSRMGETAECGGQLPYVESQALEQVKKHGSKVVIFTRMYERDFPEQYKRGEPVIEVHPESDGKLIMLHVPTSLPDEVQKERAYPAYKQELSYYMAFLQMLGITPDVNFGHYADGFVGAATIARYLEETKKQKPIVIDIAHSLGNLKEEQLATHYRSEIEKIVPDSPDAVAKRLELITELNSALQSLNMDIRKTVEERSLRYADKIGFINPLQKEKLEELGFSDNLYMAAGGYGEKSFYRMSREERKKIPAELAKAIHDDLKAVSEGDREKYGIQIPDDLADKLTGNQVILTYGRLTRQKGFMNLLRSLTERDDNGELIIDENTVVIRFGLGEIPPKESEAAAEYEQYSKFIIDHKLQGRVFMLCGRPQKEINRFLNMENGIAVFPQNFGPFELVVIEAAATGIPVIASDEIGAVRIKEALINNLHCRVAKFRNLSGHEKSRNLADQIAWAINNPDEAYEMGQRARQYVQEHWTHQKRVESDMSHVAQVMRMKNVTFSGECHHNGCSDHCSEALSGAEDRAIRLRNNAHGFNKDTFKELFNSQTFFHGQQEIMHNMIRLLETMKEMAKNGLINEVWLENADINRVDSHISENIAQFLAEVTVGSKPDKSRLMNSRANLP